MFDAAPSAGRDVEVILARHTVRRVVYVGPVLVAVLGAFRGWSGVAAAALGVAVVVVNVLVAGWVMSTAARISLNLYHAAALFGFFLRLALITLTMLVVVAVTDIDRLAFGLAVVGSYLTLLTLEAAAVARGDERELDWTR